MLRIVRKSGSHEAQASASAQIPPRREDVHARSFAESEPSVTKEELIWICTLNNMR